MHVKNKENWSPHNAHLCSWCLTFWPLYECISLFLKAGKSLHDDGVFSIDCIYRFFPFPLLNVSIDVRCRWLITFFSTAWEMSMSLRIQKPIKGMHSLKRACLFPLEEIFKIWSVCVFFFTCVFQLFLFLPKPYSLSLCPQIWLWVFAQCHKRWIYHKPN